MVAASSTATACASCRAQNARVRRERENFIVEYWKVIRGIKAQLDASKREDEMNLKRNEGRK